MPNNQDNISFHPHTTKGSWPRPERKENKTNTMNITRHTKDVKMDNRAAKINRKPNNAAVKNTQINERKKSYNM